LSSATTHQPPSSSTTTSPASIPWREVRSDNADGIACWFIDTDYNEESFFVRHAYFLGANDPYKSLRTTLKAEIKAEFAVGELPAKIHEELLRHSQKDRVIGHMARD